ncbi:MAG: hypothetical protein JW706_02515, partial [Opitutales bacterium]|nr:hypothetical protein [Opitutales bacterium]
MKRLAWIHLALGLLGLSSSVFADYRVWEIVTVQVSATVQEAPPAIVLNWTYYPNDGPYTIQRRTSGLNSPWGPPIAT